MSPRQAITHYQPIYYDDIRENIPFFRHFSPSVPATDSLVREKINLRKSENLA